MIDVSYLERVVNATLPRDGIYRDVKRPFRRTEASRACLPMCPSGFFDKSEASSIALPAKGHFVLVSHTRMESARAVGIHGQGKLPQPAGLR